jgi:hypothetical protein
MDSKKGTQMLKFQNIAKIGDTIRAYDFKPMVGREDCFVEGKVVTKGALDCGYDAYCIKVTKDSWSDAECKGRVDKLVYVPMEVDFLEFDARIMNLSR